MSTWKKHIGPFTNSKFGIERHGKLIKFSVSGSKLMRWCHSCGSQGEWVKTDLDGCTLIARKIEDMSYQELKGVPSHENWPATVDSMRNSLNQEIYHERLSVPDFLYLISIGVYPFTWEDFKGGDVERKSTD